MSRFRSARGAAGDLTLVDDLTRLIEGDLCVDTAQLFALGWSYAGAMSYAVACARPTVFRAVAVLSGATNLTGWRVTWAFAHGQTITQIWGGRNTAAGGTQNVTNESWNGSLTAGGSTTFGFLGTWNGANNVPALTCAPA